MRIYYAIIFLQKLVKLPYYYLLKQKTNSNKTKLLNILRNRMIHNLTI